MITFSRLAFVAAIVAIGAASTAYAQSSDRYGSQLPYYYSGSGAQVRGTWAPNGTEAHAALPARSGVASHAQIHRSRPHR